MVVLTRAAMAKLSRQELEDYAVNQDNEIIDELILLRKQLLEKLEKMKADSQKEIELLKAESLDQMKLYDKRFEILESQIYVTRRVNEELVTRIGQIEKNSYRNSQYSRRECIEISGIPAEIDNKSLENTALEIIARSGVNVSNENVEGCHRIGKNNATILKFSRRKDCYATLKVRKEISNMKFDDINIHAKIYVNQSLCQYYKTLRWRCKKLWENDLIHSFWVYNSKIFIRINADGNMFEISHDNDIIDLFPDIDITEICDQRQNQI